MNKKLFFNIGFLIVIILTIFLAIKNKKNYHNNTPELKKNDNSTYNVTECTTEIFENNIYTTDTTEESIQTSEKQNNEVHQLNLDFTSVTPENFVNADRETNNINNKYFFNNIESDKQYTVQYEAKDSTAVRVNNVNMSILKLCEFKNGTLYKLTFDSNGKVNLSEEVVDPYNLNLFIYVTNDKIYKINKFPDDIVKIKNESDLLDEDSMIVCSNFDIPDSLDALEDGAHFYIESDKDTKIFHYYYYVNNGNNLAEYKTIYFEKGKGITFYKSGAKAGVGHMEFILKEE